MADLLSFVQKYKSEVIMDNFTAISSSSTFSNFSRLSKAEMTLLGALVIKGTAQDSKHRHRPLITPSLTQCFSITQE